MKLMFEPRPPLEHKPPLVKRKMPPYTGVANWISCFEKDPPPLRVTMETPREKKLRLKAELKKIQDEKLELLAADWDPNANRMATE